MNISRKAWHLILLTGIIFFSMLGRAIFSPLLPFIQDELGLSQSQAGSFFLVIASGYAPAMLLSGFVAARLRHRGTIVLALALNSVGLAVTAASFNYAAMCFGLLLIGVGSGFYPPSGMASITSMVSAEKTGKAMAVHEMGPNIALVTAPLIVLFLYNLLSWRGILCVLGALDLVVLAVYVRRKGSGDFIGTPPKFDCLKVIVTDPAVWIIMLLFAVALGSTQGVFAILPLYLITAKGLNPDSVNTLVSISRVSGVLVLFVSGALVDRFGAKVVIVSAFVVSGFCTLFMGILSGAALLFVSVIQPALITAFFPAGLTMLARVGPADSRNVTFSVVINIAVFLGSGAVPSFFGFLGDRGILSLGFMLLGGIMLGTALFTCLNRSLGGAEKAAG